MLKIVGIVALFVLLAAGGYLSFHVFAAEKNQSATVIESITPTTTPVIETNELLPDLLPLPAQDMTVVRQEGVTKILFSTTYYNQGQGPLELIADPATIGVRADHKRDVFQRVQQKNGETEDHLVGTFEWHQEHLHYHFTDFIEYDLISVSAPEHEDLSGSRIKATFCIRDISIVDMELPNRSEDPLFKICGKERQGVSVGWGDTYYYNYPAQFLDVTGLESGIYRFDQKVNPASLLKETNYGNNISSVTFDLDMEKGTVKIISQSPATVPKVEHVRLDDPMGM